MTTNIYTKAYKSPPVQKNEIFRYAGAAADVPHLNALVDECLAEAFGVLTYKVCYKEFPVSELNGTLDLGFAKTTAAGLKRNLRGSSSLILFAASVGIGIDRLIARYSKISPVKALVFSAIGSERVESLADVFEGEVREMARERGGITHTRFSPGYGDFPLEMQRDIFAALDCPRKIGVTLGDTMLMSPTKSVTAIIGIEVPK